MSSKPLVVLPAAERDIRSAVIFYRNEAGAQMAGRFIAALERQYRLLVRHPGAGSQRHGAELGIDGLRTSSVARFPYLIFYVEFEDRVEIWRVLHEMRDIPATFR